MRIGIIGSGAIGLLLAHYLHKNNSITLYVQRMEQKKLLENKKLHFYEQSTFIEKHNITVRTIADLQVEELFIITVKQAGIQNLVQQLAPIAIDTPIIFTQNGMGHTRLATQYFRNAFIGIVEHGAVRMSDYEVNHLGKGSIKLAALTGTQKEIQQLHQLLHQDNFPFEIHYDAELLLKEKLIVNAVINPLTALFDVPNKMIVEDEHLCFLAKQLCSETAEALQLNEFESWERIKRIADATGNNTSSMRADILNRRKTEIEAVTGYIMKTANRPIPFSQFIYHAIVSIEKRKCT